MKVEELRIGNYVQGGKVSGISQMFANEPYAIEIKDESEMHEEVEISEVKPIPLTEEWLQKFGVFAANGTFAFDFEPAGKIIRTNIKYVHQLQNLYFALTGEELTLTDKPQGLSAQEKQRRT